jgi:hypothetical protein
MIILNFLNSIKSMFIEIKEYKYSAEIQKVLNKTGK